MGQKINPIGLRLGITESWRSRWWADKKSYARYVVEDEKIRKFVKKEYKMAGISRIDIERNLEKCTVIVYAARPGLMIGRKGANIDKLTEDLVAMVKYPIDVKIIEIERPELNAQLISESIAEQLEKRAHFRRVMHRATETVMNAGALGIKILLAGRLGGAEIARTEEMIQGKIPLQTLRADIDYGTTTAVLTKGTIGVKVWIYKGEIFPEKTTPPTQKINQEPEKPTQSVPLPSDTGPSGSSGRKEVNYATDAEKSKVS